jgi:CheY-like chemotaxis protein
VNRSRGARGRGSGAHAERITSPHPSAPDPSSSVRHEAPVLSRHAARGIDLTGLYVLVVDDDPDSLDILATFLRYAGALVSLASSGDHALRALGHSTPDLVICDLAMPNGSGWWLVEQLKSDDRTRSIPTVAVTAYSNAFHEPQTRKAGFDAYLTKPLDPVALCRAVASLVPDRRGMAGQDEVESERPPGPDQGPSPDTRVA